MKPYYLIYFCLLTVGFVFAQDKLPQDYLDSEFHQNRREAFRASMPENSVAVFFANPVRNRSNDVDFVYHQDPNLYYLTGYKEPHAVLLIFSEKQQVQGSKVDEVLYVQKRNERYEQWMGVRLGPERAMEELGLALAYNGEEFINAPIDFSKFDKILFKKFEDDVRKSGREQPNLYALIEQFKSSINAIPVPEQKKLDAESSEMSSIVDYELFKKLMASQREVKTDEELVLIKKAVEISCVGQNEVMKAMHPGMSESETQGIHEMVFKKYGSEYEGYPSIVGGGNNGCVLHYVDNNKTEIGNDLVLMDLGAEYHGYTADVTRTIPASGKFSKEQKLIYDIVYDAQEAGIAATVIGNTTRDIDAITRKVVYEGLIKLGLIQSLKEGRRYFPHGTSHHIGLDVHDLNNGGPLEKNMIITVEPGIYIPDGSPCDEKWWGIAVRIEDDVLVTENGPINYSALAPRKSEEIEKMMKEKSVFDHFHLPDLDQGK